MGVHSCVAETRNLRMHYLQKGTGDPVVLIHGWPQSSYEWRHQVDDLGEDRACFAPDLRGFGRTDKPGARITRSLVATDVIRLLDALGIEPLRSSVTTGVGSSDSRWRWTGRSA